MKTDIQIAQEAEMKHIREVQESQRMNWNFMESIKQSFLMNSGNGSRTARTESWFLLQPLIRPRRERERRQFL